MKDYNPSIKWLIDARSGSLPLDKSNTRPLVPVDREELDAIRKRVDFLERMLRKSTFQDEPISDNDLHTIHAWYGEEDR